MQQMAKQDSYILIFAQMQMRLIFVFGYIVKSLVVSISYYISSDTDVYHIGLSVVGALDECDVINPRRACARGLQYLSCLCVCVCVCVCVFLILAPRAIRRTNSSISDFSAIRA